MLSHVGKYAIYIIEKLPNKTRSNICISILDFVLQIFEVNRLVFTQVPTLLTG